MIARLENMSEYFRILDLDFFIVVTIICTLIIIVSRGINSFPHCHVMKSREFGGLDELIRDVCHHTAIPLLSLYSVAMEQKWGGAAQNVEKKIENLVIF